MLEIWGGEELTAAGSLDAAPTVSDWLHAQHAGREEAKQGASRPRSHTEFATGLLAIVMHER